MGIEGLIISDKADLRALETLPSILLFYLYCIYSKTTIIIKVNPFV